MMRTTSKQFAWSIDRNNIMHSTSNKTPGKSFRSRSQLALHPSILTSPKKQQLAHSYKLTLSCIGLLDSLKHHRATPDAKLVHALHPQLHKKTLENVYRVNKSRSLKQILETKLKTQEQRMHELKMRDQARQKEIVQNRKKQTREQQRRSKLAMKEAEQQRQLERSWRQKTQQRQRSQSSLLRETRRDSIGMLRRSRLQQDKSQRSLAEQELRETVRSGKYTQQKRSLQSRKEHYERQYKKAFLKNTPPPKQDLPENVLYRTLREKAQSLTQTYALPQHLPQIAKRTPSRLSQKGQLKRTGKLQKELMISSYRPSDPTKSNKQRIPNPQVSPLPIPETKTPHPILSSLQVPVPVATTPSPQNQQTN